MYSLDKKLEDIALAKPTPRLLLHCCCAPCASYVLEYISPFFEISVLFYNPNIYPGEEYYKREAEFEKLLSAAVYPNSVEMLSCDYDDESFRKVAAPFWGEPEGGRRCRECYSLRLEEAARRAKEGGYDYFATTLTVSPYKDAKLLSEIGIKLEGKYGVRYLVSDFKKRDGYKRSIDLSKQFSLYRQVYCGCQPSIVIK